MISHNQRFVFIHVPKAAGSSIEYALRQYSNTPVSFSSNGNAILEDKHKTAHEMKEALGPLWNSYFSFGVVRNPWERVVSNFLYLLNIDHPMTKGAKSPREWILNNNVWCYPAYNYLFIDEKLAVNGLIRHETLQEDFNRICEAIEIENIELPHMNKTAGKHFTEYYDDESRDIIAQLFERDIYHFGYKFGTLEN